jgi:hypothetical protein
MFRPSQDLELNSTTVFKDSTVLLRSGIQVCIIELEHRDLL